MINNKILIVWTGEWPWDIRIEKQIETLKHQTESYTNKRVKFLKEHEIAQLEQQMNVYKSVINQKTTQARNIRA